MCLTKMAKGEEPMANKINSKENWNEARDKIHTQWERISLEEIDQTRGQIPELTQLIASRYGEDKPSILKKLFEIMDVSQQTTFDPDQSGIVVDTRDPGTREWDSREDVNERF
jgi:hypothetical protein